MERGEGVIGGSGEGSTAEEEFFDVIFQANRVFVQKVKHLSSTCFTSPTICTGRKNVEKKVTRGQLPSKLIN